jgi:hypothetical protein
LCGTGGRGRLGARSGSVLESMPIRCCPLLWEPHEIHVSLGTVPVDEAIVIDWQCVPDRFRYFREAVEACGETRILPYSETLGRYIHFLDNVTDKQLVVLGRVYEKVLAQDDVEDLWDWLEDAEQGFEAENAAAWHVCGILMVFSELAERDKMPFSRERISPCRPRPPIQGIGVLAQLPEELSYLVAPALKYGRYQFDQQMLEFLEHATADEMDELAAIAERVLLNDHYPEVSCFLDQYSIVDYEEASRLYFLFGVLDCAGFQFDRVPEE